MAAGRGKFCFGNASGGALFPARRGVEEEERRERLVHVLLPFFLER